MIAYNTAVVLAGAALLGAGAGLAGCFAVLRRRALTGDALAHAALPGLCIAFLVVGERNVSAMLIGALATGLLGIATISAIRRWTRIKEDAAIGIVLSVFFGAGIVLGRLIQNRVASGSRAGLDSYILGKTAGMIASDVAVIAAVAAVCTMFVVVFFKEFLLVSFDSEFAIVQGWPARRIDLALMAFVAVTVVISLPTAGVVLTAALLILPGAAARFWTDRLGTMAAISSGIGAAMGLGGSALSASFEKLPAGPVITLVGTGLFAISALFAPRRGWIARTVQHTRDRWRMDYDEVLRRMNEGGEFVAERLPETWGASPARMRRLIDAGLQSGDLTTESGALRLTGQGRDRAAEVERRQRLWRLLLEEYPDLASQARPLSGEAVEDQLSPEMAAELATRLRDTAPRSEAVR